MKPTPLLLTCLIGLAVPRFGLAQPTIQFTTTSYTVTENAGQATLTVQRTVDLTTLVSVDFATADGTATNEFKYTAVSGTLSFGAGETNKVIAVPILNDGLVGGAKNFRVSLSNPTGGAVLGTRTNVLVSITDNDTPLTVEFAKYEVREDEAAVVIGVLRGNDGNQTVTVDYATGGLTATAGTDYTETTGSLTFALGEKLKLVSIPILNDALKEPNETFRFTLTNAVGTSLGTQKSATITIQDNDPGAGFVTAKYFIHEDEGALRVTVRRGNDLALGPFTVDYATVDGTALAGQDYVATSGTLVFAAGEMSRSFEVPVINDGILEADENFRVALSNVSGDASLGTVTNLTVILCDATGMTPHGFAAIQRDPDGFVRLTFAGEVSQRFEPFFDLYPVEVSTNLVDWEPLALLQRTNSATNELTFVDTAAGTFARFYRVPTNHFTAAYPKPTGPYPVGRIDRLVTDPTRRNRYGISTNGTFAVSVWYPAAPTAGQRPARWFEEVVARDTSSASFWAWAGNTNWFDRLPYLWTYSFSDAPLAEVSGAFPVVLFSPGFHVNRRHDSEKLEGLASHGYVVVAVDHYYNTWDIAWPDGFYYTRSIDEPESANTDKDRFRDLVVVLDELTNWNQTDARFAGRLGLDKIGAMGMSSGGTAVANLGQQDARCKAVVLLDSGYGGEDFRGFSKPSMTMIETKDPAYFTADQEVFAPSKTNAVLFQISNTDHATFSSGVIFSSYPPATNLEAVRTINAYALSFFNKWLKGQDDHLHEGPSTNFPRVINFWLPHRTVHESQADYDRSIESGDCVVLRRRRSEFIRG
ncbi:MAG: hypothetical protein HY043_02965 [Verrucomicrobia bacterium]|nr:hypothetical protein [Verrucomicrobiota bacterium]